MTQGAHPRNPGWRMQSRWDSLTVHCTLLLLPPRCSPTAQNYSIDWFTIDAAAARAPRSVPSVVHRPTQQAAIDQRTVCHHGRFLGAAHRSAITGAPLLTLAPARLVRPSSRGRPPRRVSSCRNPQPLADELLNSASGATTPYRPRHPVTSFIACAAVRRNILDPKLHQLVSRCQQVVLRERLIDPECALIWRAQDGLEKPFG